MKKAKTQKKAVRRRKGPKRVRLQSVGPEFLAQSIESIPERLHLFSAYMTPTNIVLDIAAAPGDPLRISHVLIDVVDAYATLFGKILGRDPAEIVSAFLLHFAELLDDKWPTLTEEEAAEQPDGRVH